MGKGVAPLFCVEVFSQKYKLVQRVLSCAGLPCIGMNMVTNSMDHSSFRDASLGAFISLI
jgi:hypothetical protein